MDNELFVKKAKQMIFAEFNHGKQLPESNYSEMFVVWLSKIGPNNKCLIGINGSNDYFEMSYFGDEGEFVLDHYTLKEHISI